MIESSVSGRVKKINVSAGSDLSDIMVSDGALMVLSLDGKMAVSLSGVSGVSAGDSVTVTLSSGTQVTGTVDSASGEDCVVTLTDNGTTYGDTVIVTDSSGHEPLEITGPSGTVSAVNVSENASVSEGTTLLPLEGSANETQYQELLAKREARTATLKKLIQLKADPEIKAEISGTVQSVNVLRQMVKIVVDVNDEKEIQEFPVRDLKFRPKKKKGKGGAGSADHDEKEAKKGDSKPNEK